MLMSPQFSNACWIASPLTSAPESQSGVSYFRKSFSLGQPVQSAHLHVTALGLYECKINGMLVGDHVCAPGWTEYSKRVHYQSYEITSLLKSGENALGAMLAEGWYCGYVGYRGARNLYGATPLLLARLEVNFTDGSTLNIVSDGSWKAGTGPILEADLQMGETYDARLALPRWSQPGFDDALLRNALVAVAPAIELSPSDAPPMRRMQELKPVSVSQSPKGDSQIYDLGQNFTGRVRIAVQGRPGDKVTLTHAEVLNPDGSLYTENLRQARSVDTYICAGGGREEWEPRFTFHGFRYVEISGLPLHGILEVTGIVIHSDTPLIGAFSCSNPLINQLQHNILWGQKSNFLDLPTDCPQRDERLGWTGDAQVFIRTAAFNMDVRGFFRKWLEDVRDAQKPNGCIPAVIPDINVREDGGPAWSDAAIICPWTVYLCYGDTKILADNYDCMRRFMDFLVTHRCKGYIRSHPDIDAWAGFGDWLAQDNSGSLLGATPHDLIGTAFYAYDAELMARIAAILGHEEEVRDYTALHKAIVTAFQQRYITPDGLIVSGTQTAYVLALHFGLIPEGLRTNAAQELVRDIRNRKFHLSTGFVGTPYILDALESCGHLDVAYKLLEQETFPSWLFPIHNGATTIWERWDGWTPEKGFQDKNMNSFNHYAYGAVGAWMYRSVAGLELDPQHPGYEHIVFRPRPGGSITWAQARLNTPHGEASIQWRLENGHLELDLLVPAGSKARICAPDGYLSPVSELGAGGHHLTLIRS